MQPDLNLFYPEWQGYGKDQQVFHGAHHLCRHVIPDTSFEQVDVSTEERLIQENGILGLASALSLLDQAQSIIENVDPNHIFTIGGTCACELAPVSFLNKKYDGDLAVFWFDAHGDLNTPATSPSGRLHGMPLRLLLGDGEAQLLNQLPSNLLPEQVALVGTRDLDPGEVDYINQNKLPLFDQHHTRRDALIDFVKTQGYSNVYIHFDLDVLEPNEFPHVLVPTPDGLGVNQATRMLATIRKNFDVVGASVVEYCPQEGGNSEALHKLLTAGFGYPL